jgi:hypothetical protein
MAYSGVDDELLFAVAEVERLFGTWNLNLKFRLHAPHSCAALDPR